jgi:acyl-CoA thioesterase-1
MAEQNTGGGMKRGVAWLAAGMACAAAAGVARGADAPTVPPAYSAIVRGCAAATANTVEMAPLPNAQSKLKTDKEIKILAIGAPAVGGVDSDDDHHSLEETLERGVKGLRADLINRGVSGELARDAAARIKIEVGLNAPNLVIWQVGTSDALARVPVTDFEETLRDTLRWLKERRVDVILVGAKYSRVMQRDASYQALRKSVFRVANEENVTRISQYRAMEAMEKAWAGSSGAVDAYELSEEIYPCVAQYVAQAVIATVFNRQGDGQGMR